MSTERGPTMISSIVPVVLHPAELARCRTGPRISRTPGGMIHRSARQLAWFWMHGNNVRHRRHHHTQTAMVCARYAINHASSEYAPKMISGQRQVCHLPPPLASVEVHCSAYTKKMSSATMVGGVKHLLPLFSPSS